MKDEEAQELHVLNISTSYILGKLDERIDILTNKALSFNMEEKDRLKVLSAIEELKNLRAVMVERHKYLRDKQQKENKDGR